MENPQYSVVITTTSNLEDAEKLARSILEERLGACVQIQQITSLYKWKGEQCRDAECLLFVKTKHDLFSQLAQHIKANHSYETPEILELPVARGLEAYLSWIDESTR